MAAETLLILSNTIGLLANFPDESSLLHRVPYERLAAAEEAAQDG